MGEREGGRDGGRERGREGEREGEREEGMREQEGSNTMRDIPYQPVQSSEPEAKRLGSQWLYTTDHTRLLCS